VEDVKLDKVPFIRTAFNYDRDFASLASGQDNLEPSMTRQHFKDEVDINSIYRRFAQTGETPPQSFPLEVDFLDAPDFHTALNLVTQAQQSFSLLDPSVRFRHNNDPREFLLWLNDPANRKEAQDMGIVNPDPVTEAAPAPAGGGEATG